MELDKYVNEIDRLREKLCSFYSIEFNLTKETAEDLYQDTVKYFISNGHKTYNPDRKFFPWFRRCYENKIRDYMREKKTRIKIENAFDFDRLLDHSENENDGGYDSDNILKCVNNLRFNYEEVIMMRYWNDIGPNDIGEILGVNRKTIKWRLREARKELKFSLLKSPEREYIRDLRKVG